MPAADKPPFCACGTVCEWDGTFHHWFCPSCEAEPDTGKVDEALEEHLRWIRDGHDCKDPECHYCEAAHHIRQHVARLEKERDDCFTCIRQQNEEQNALLLRACRAEAERDARPTWEHAKRIGWQAHLDAVAGYDWADSWSRRMQEGRE